MEEAVRSLTQLLGRAPQEAEIAREMKLDLAEFHQLLSDLKGLGISSLHTERSEYSGEEELTFLPASPQDDPLFRCMQGKMKQRLMDAIKTLPVKERLVLTLS